MGAGGGRILGAPWATASSTATWASEETRARVAGRTTVGRLFTADPQLIRSVRPGT